MSQPAWYPDPSGQPHTYRYWDGHSWSHETTTNPYDAPPGTPPPSGFGTAPRRNLAPVVVAIVLVLLVVGGGVAAAILLANDDGDGSRADEGRTTETTDETDSTQGAAPLEVCPPGDPLQREPVAPDGRIHGGGISFAPIPGYSKEIAEPNLGQFEWLHDVDGVARVTELTRDAGWISLVVAGGLRRADGYVSPEQAATSLVGCMAGSRRMYSGFDSTEEVSSEATEVDGHPAWVVRQEIRVAGTGLRTEGDTAVVVVVDTGDEDVFAVFAGVAPLGNDRLLRRLESTVDGLTVDATSGAH